MGKDRSISRRGFLHRGMAALGAAAAPCIVSASALGRGATPASDRVAMGFIGVGGQGGGHLAGGAWTYLPGGYLGRDDVQILAVCDVVRGKRDGYTQRVNDHYAQKFGKDAYKACQAYVDFRDVLARPDIDAVLIGTPEHWHEVMATMAAKAGKDIYCEKPIALTVRGGRAMADAVRRYGRVYQAGTQQRSEYGGKFRFAIEIVRSGRIGKLQKVYAYQSCGTGFVPEGSPPGARGTPPPEGLDWDLFLGPARWAPHGAGPTYFGGAGGDTNWSPHHYDIAQWGIGADDTGPVEIFHENGAVAFRYANGVILYSSPYPGETWGPGRVCFVGTEGRVTVDRDAFFTVPASIGAQPIAADEAHVYFANSHSGNFLDCVRTRKKTICHEEIAQRSISVILIGGIANLVRRPLKWDPQKEEFVGDPDANRYLGAAFREPWHV